VSAIAGGLFGWLTFAGLSALTGLLLGGVIFFVLHKVFGLGHQTGAGH